MDQQQIPGQLIVPHPPKEPDQQSVSPPEPERPNETQGNDPSGILPLPDPSNSIQVESRPIVLSNSRVAESDAAPANTTWQFSDELTIPPSNPLNGLESENAPLSWTASEFIAHEKNIGWYVLLALGGIVLSGLVYVLTKDKISAGVVLSVAIMFGVFASRKPGTVNYMLEENGLRVGAKLYDLQDFKTFSIGQDGSIASVVLTPLKRFMPPLTVYLAPELADSVVDYLGNLLPFEQHKNDAIDSLLKRMRF